jgi:tRNA(fMet)-specific endonuclease VapC
MAIGPYDVLIAGQAIARDMIRITHHTGEFGRVPGLQMDCLA